ncbi:hypothetical protein M569_02627 [Genlisea aurea]|uniref:Response regulatory domain-containing protein n=1 Tax=Genlisea aurea TaxID=192259 RepID=S8EHF1_9LAMI|nr:hypothetical protein M569_02627 [Genlisea aurea]
MVTKGLLAHLGCIVVAVSSGDECVRAVSEEDRIVFLATGAASSGDSSDTTAARILDKFSKRGVGGRPSPPPPMIVALAGSGDAALRDRCVRMGMAGVVVKPVSVDMMRSVLSQLLDHGCIGVPPQ